MVFCQWQQHSLLFSVRSISLASSTSAVPSSSSTPSEAPPLMITMTRLNSHFPIAIIIVRTIVMITAIQIQMTIIKMTIS